MTTFDKAIEFVLESEGGISEDPNDPGGLTNFGISQRAYPAVNIRRLSREDAIGIYKRDYFDAIHGDALPPAIAILLMDTAVNQGVAAAVRILQCAVGVRTDGVMGPQTLQAVASTSLSKLTAELVARRMNTYGLNPAFTRYGLGWSRRVAQCHQLAMETI